LFEIFAGFVACEVIAEVLDASAQQTQVLLDLLGAVVDDEVAVRLAADGTPTAVDAYRLLLFLLVHFYTREAAKTDTADVWPVDQQSMFQAEPSSPMRLTSAWSKEQAHHRAHLPATRQKMQEHVLCREALIAGFRPFLAKNVTELVALIGDPNPEPSNQEILEFFDWEGPSVMPLTPAQIDRLGFLLVADTAVSHHVDVSATENMDSESERPMDMCRPLNPALPTHQRLSEAFPSSIWSSDSNVSVQILSAWIKEGLSCQDGDGGSSLGDINDTTMTSMSPSPPRISVFNQLLPPTLSMVIPSDVYSLHRATALRGESDFVAGSNSIRVLDCHDAVVYCLAPLHYATISCCADCVVVLGAVGRAVRLERCERVQVIVAARTVTINTCHDCILYLGVNRPPVLLGDNRFVQFAPHNAGYDSLPEHMAKVGVQTEPNHWADAFQLVTESRSKHHHHAAPPLHGSPPGSWSPPLSGVWPMAAAGGGGEQHPPATVLPPDKLMPFLVPFTGGMGPLCGGAAARHRESSVTEDTISGLLTQENVDSAVVAFSRTPFPLPSEYVAAWEVKMAGVTTVRSAYREAALDDGRKREFMAAIQSHFKEWLQAGGGMREVYDLAKVEKERRKESVKEMQCRDI